MNKTITYSMALVALLAVVRLAIMATSSVFETSEARYAAICGNMAKSGDFMVPRFTYNGEKVEFTGKPPLYFQLGGIAAKAMPGAVEFAVRLPAFLSAFLIVAIIFGLVRRECDVTVASRAALIVAATPAFYTASGFCFTDMLLSAAIVGAWAAWYRFDRGGVRGWLVMTFVFLALGMMTKGPVAIALFGIPVFFWTLIGKRWAELKRGGRAWLWGVALFVIISAPWFVAREVASPGFLEYFFIHENFLRFLKHDYGDMFGAGREFFRGMSVVWMIVMSLPWLLVWGWERLRPHVCTDGKDLPEHEDYAKSTSSLGRFAMYCVCGVAVFWAFTSRVPLLYLLPAAPMAATAFALGRWSRLRNVVAFATVIALVLVLPIVPWVAESTGWKMPKHFFERVMAMIPPNAKVQFGGKCPYSAEFYIEDIVTQDGKDPRAYRLCREDSVSRYLAGRTEIARGCGWVLLSPEESGLDKSSVK